MPNDRSDQSDTTTLVAPDIVCGGCAGSATRALGALAGVREVRVDVPTRTVTVRHDERATRAAIVEALDAAGFPAVTP